MQAILKHTVRCRIIGVLHLAPKLKTKTLLFAKYSRPNRSPTSAFEAKAANTRDDVAHFFKRNFASAASKHQRFLEEVNKCLNAISKWEISPSLLQDYCTSEHRSLAVKDILRRLYEGERTVVCFIHGPSGIGKTTFASLLPRLLLDRLPPGSQFQTLAKTRTFRLDLKNIKNVFSLEEKLNTIFQSAEIPSQQDNWSKSFLRLINDSRTSTPLHLIIDNTDSIGNSMMPTLLKLIRAVETTERRHISLITVLSHSAIDYAGALKIELDLLDAESVKTILKPYSGTLARFDDLAKEMGGYPGPVKLLKEAVESKKLTSLANNNIHSLRTYVLDAMRSNKYRGFVFENSGLLCAVSLLKVHVDGRWKIMQDSKYAFNDLQNHKIIYSERQKSGKLTFEIPRILERYLCSKLPENPKWCFDNMFGRLLDTDFNSYEDYANSYVAGLYALWGELARVNKVQLSSRLIWNTDDLEDLVLQTSLADLSYETSKSKVWLEKGDLPDDLTQKIVVPDIPLDNKSVISLYTCERSVFVRLGGKNIFDGVLITRTADGRMSYTWVDAKHTTDVTPLSTANLNALKWKFDRIERSLEGEHRLIVVTNRKERDESPTKKMLIVYLESINY